MRKEKTLPEVLVGDKPGKPVVIRELRPIDIINFGKKCNELIENLSLETILTNQELAQEILSETSNLKLDDLLYLGFSEVKAIGDLFREVNSDFLLILDYVKLLETGRTLLKTWWGELMEGFQKDIKIITQEETQENQEPQKQEKLIKI